MGFPQILLQLKTQYGYTNAYIGNACGVSEGAVRTWLSGKKAPSSNALKSLSDLFDVSADYLIGSEPKEKPTIQTDDELDSEFSDLVRKLTPEQLELVKAQIKGILSNY